MSRFTPPPPEPSPGPDHPQLGPAQPVPISTAALVGFISSVVICVPIITQLVGLILGIVGIASTANRRTRGRGLAIAAVCISPLVAAIWVSITVLAVSLLGSMAAVGRDIQPMLAEGQLDLPAVVSAIRQASFSKRLKLQVDDQDLLDFARRVVETHGHLKHAESADKPFTRTEDGQGLLLRFIGEFTGGAADIEVTIGFDGLSVEIDNIAVGELSLVQDQ